MSSAARLVLIDSGADKTFVSRLCALGKSLEAYVRAGAYKVTPGRTLFVGALGSKPMAADGRVEDVTFALSNGAQTATWESPVYLTDSRAYDVLVGMDSNRCLGVKPLDLAVWVPTRSHWTAILGLRLVACSVEWAKQLNDPAVSQALMLWQRPLVWQRRPLLCRHFRLR